MDDGGGDARAVAAVAFVDILHHLLAPFVLEIDVDIGRLVALGRDEALEQQIVFHRIDRGRTEERRVGKECVSKGRSRWWPSQLNKNILQNINILSIEMKLIYR